MNKAIKEKKEKNANSKTISKYQQQSVFMKYLAKKYKERINLLSTK